MARFVLKELTEKGMSFIMEGEMSPEALERFRRNMAKRDERLRQMAEDARNGKYDDLIRGL